MFINFWGKKCSRIDLKKCIFPKILDKGIQKNEFPGIQCLRYQYCATVSVLQSLYYNPCTTISVLQSLYYSLCTTVSVLQSLYYNPCTLYCNFYSVVLQTKVQWYIITSIVLLVHSYNHTILSCSVTKYLETLDYLE